MRQVSLLAAFLMLLSAPFAWAQSANYRIQPGDQLAITVLEDDSLNRTVLVLPDGRISVPLAGGLDRFAATKRIQLRRTDPATGQERLYIFNYNAVERGGAIESMITLREGDVVLVPERHLFE